MGTGTRKPQKAVINRNGILYLTLGDQAGPNNMVNGEVWKLDTTTGTWTNIAGSTRWTTEQPSWRPQPLEPALCRPPA